MMLRGKTNLLECSSRVNIEADSLNAAILGPDVSAGETRDVFLQDVLREITQKTGQKCTAVRRILVPAEKIDEVQSAMIERLQETVAGNPRDRSVTMGPLTTREQLDAATSGIARLTEDADLVKISEGEMFFTGPMVEHTMVFTEDTVFLTFGRRPVKSSSYISKNIKIFLSTLHFLNQWSCKY